MLPNIFFPASFSTKVVPLRRRFKAYELEANDFSHLIAKARFHIRYFFEDISNSVVSNIFPTPINALATCNFIGTDMQ